jgi:histidine ammonia-lyase
LSKPLERAKAALREAVAHLDEDRWQKPDLQAATTLVREGAFIDAVGHEFLPRIG